MCGRYTLTTTTDLLVSLFGAQVPSTVQLRPRYNIAPTQQAPVVRWSGQEEQRVLAPLRWGLVPHWSKDPGASGAGGPALINARAETAATKPAFREALRKRRCLVPTDGFFEWKTVGDLRQPYYVRRADGRPFAYAGLFERWQPPEGAQDLVLESFTILTTAPNALLATLHDRMPLILDPAVYDRWLDHDIEDPDAIGKMLAALPPRLEQELTFHPVSRRVNSPGNDDAACIERVAEPPAGEPTLFE
jgi:putative SOS response-associated peptidase YedK